MNPAATAARKYGRVEIMTMAIGGVTAIYLYFEVVKCQSALYSTSKAGRPRPTFEGANGSCFLITNSYVYSFFGFVAGISLLSLSASKPAEPAF